MTRDDIIRMAREANILEPLGYDCPDRKNWRDDVVRSLSKFADLVAAAERERIIAVNAKEIKKVNAHLKALEDAVAAEREACAKVCDEFAAKDKLSNYYAVAARAVRARGETK